MKRLNLLWASLMVGTLTTDARADRGAPWTDRTAVGIAVGVDLATQGGSWLNEQSFDRRQPKIGPVAGGLLAIRLTGFLSAQTEINFVAKGIRWDTPNPASSSTSDADYVEIPVLARASLPLWKRVEPYTYLGPAFAILVDADVAFDDGRFDERNGNVSTFDIGLMFGGGIAFDLGGDIGAVTFDLRYNLGLRNINTAIDDPNDEVLNRAIYLTVGYRADLATLGRLFGRGSRPRGPAEPAAPAAAAESSPGSRR